MSTDADPQKESEIRIGKIIWPKTWEGPRSDQQQRSLLERLQAAKHGLIVDCSGVEVGNSEIVTLLMRIRNHATKSGKVFVLFDVPNTLLELLKICNLQSVLLTAKDAAAAKDIVSRHVQNPKKKRSRWWWVTPWR
jgi:anti-anti-sigma regulatory factor